MDLSKIIAITGKPGLYKVLGQSGQGLLVESLMDGKRMPTYSSQQVSSLAEISIYGKEADKPLKEIFESILKVENGGKPSVDVNADKSAIRDYFSDIYPDYAADRVYDSDIRKVLKWYVALLEKNLLIIEEETPSEAAVEEGVESSKAPSVKKVSKAAKPVPKPGVAGPKGGGKSSGAKGGVKATIPRKAS